jgi:hypothetical protein
MMFLAIFHPPNISKIREFTSGCSNPSIFRKLKACKFLFNSQFLRNINIRIIFTIKRWYFKLEFMKSIVNVAYLTSSMAIPAMAIMLYRMVSIVVIKFRISRILIPIVIDLLIIVVVVVMPLMHVVFSCHKVIEMPQQSSKAVVDTSNGCLHCPKLGVGGKLCGLQHTNPLICDMYISINSFRVLLHLTYQSLNIPFVRGDRGGVCSSSSVRPAMVRSTKRRRKQVKKNKNA